MTDQTSTTAKHDEVETLKVDVVIPEHVARATTALFSKTRDQLIAREGGHCWVCGRTASEAGPLEAHHNPVERSLAEMIDFSLVMADAKAGHLGPYAQAFDWDNFMSGAETVQFTVSDDVDNTGKPIPPYIVDHLKVKDPYLFVDDMTVNGLLLCKDHHTRGDEGIHTMPYPLFLAQRYGLLGYRFTAAEIIHHEG